MRLVITGASSGIGRAIALECAEPGGRLLVAARRAETLEDVAQECRDRGAAEVVPVVYDAMSAESANHLASAVLANGEGPIGLVNCAGAATFGPVSEMPLDAIEQQIKLNFLGPVMLTHALLPALTPGSVIVNILSIAAEATLPGAAAYSGAKAGARHFFRVLREEVRKQGIRVTNILPGATLTPVWDGAEWRPSDEDMITPEGLAKIVYGVIHQPPQQTVDEMTVLPIKGIL